MCPGRQLAQSGRSAVCVAGLALVEKLLRQRDRIGPPRPAVLQPVGEPPASVAGRASVSRLLFGTRIGDPMPDTKTGERFPGFFVSRPGSPALRHAGWAPVPFGCKGVLVGPSRYKPFLPCKNVMLACALASALLASGGALAGAPGLTPSQAQPALPVQYLEAPQDQYGRYRQDQYGSGQRRYDDQQEQYGSDRRRYDDQQDQYRQDQYRQGQRGRDNRQDRYGQQGGGRGGSYQQSCGDIRQEGSTLSAVCGDGRGNRVESSINVNRCGRSDIGNNRGYLQCGNIRANGHRVN